MRYAVLLSLLLAMFAVAQEQPKEPDIKPVDKGTLPTGWRKLGLTDEQRKLVYGVQKFYGDKIDTLDAQIEQLKLERTKRMLKVLTAEQLKLLKD